MINKVKFTKDGNGYFNPILVKGTPLQDDLGIDDKGNYYHFYNKKWNNI